MQSNEGVAQERGHETSDISAPVVQGTASLAVSPCSLGRDSSRDG